jgi:hypothetical protein
VAAPEIPIGPAGTPAGELRKLENAVRAALKRQAAHVRPGRFASSADAGRTPASPLRRPPGDG